MSSIGAAAAHAASTYQIKAHQPPPPRRADKKDARNDALADVKPPQAGSSNGPRPMLNLKV